MNVWQGLRLEYALLWMGERRGVLEHIKEILKDCDAASDRVPPFPLELLIEAKRRFEPSRVGKDLLERTRPQYVYATRMLERARRAAPHVRRLLHQLIRPSGNASLPLFIDSVVSACRDLNYHTKQQCVTEACRDAWAMRSVLPFRGSDGHWLPSIACYKGLVRGVRAPWSRWNDILEGFDALLPFREILLDGLRRVFGWSFLVLVENNKVAIPIVVLAGLAPGTSAAPDVRWVGLGKVLVWPAFRNQAVLATGIAIDTWISRNRVGRGMVSGGLPIDSAYGSTLVLDASLTSQAIKSLNIPLALDDQSAGLATAMGVIGLLSGHPIDPTTWTTGTLFNERRFLDSFSRKHHDGLIIRYDGRVGWVTPDSSRLRGGLVQKLLLARAHGIARDFVFPADGAEHALADFDRVARDLNNADRTPTISVARVPLVSVGADSVLPVTFRKVRTVLAPDILWAFSLGHRTRNTFGAYQPLEPMPLEKGRLLLANLRNESVLVISGPPASGKTYAICQAFAAARCQLHESRRVQPHVTVVRWPRFTGLVEETWRMTLQALSFPMRDIETFLEATDPEDQARIFVAGLRSHGPDMLLLCGIDERLEEERKLAERSSMRYQRKTLLAIADLVTRERRYRDPAEAATLGNLELIMESNALVNESLPHQELAPFPWRSEEAWEATHRRLEQSALGLDALELLGALALPESAFSGRVPQIARDVLSHRNDDDRNAANLQCLRTARLIYRKGEFRLIAPWDSPQGDLIETGPLLREAQGRMHIHPLIRTHAASFFTRKSNQGKIGRFLRRVATEDTCPFLADVHGAGLAPTMSLHPERLLQAHDQLSRAEVALEEASGQPGVQQEREIVRFSRLELLSHYHDPHHSVAHFLHTMKDKGVMSGASGSLRRRRAFMLMREYLRRVGPRAHPERWLLLVDIARRLEPEDVLETDATDRDAFKLGACLEALLGAETAASSLRAPDADLYRTKVEAWFASWVIARSGHPKFPFGHSLPVRFESDHAEHTFEQTLRHASDEELSALPLEIFCEVGDTAASRGDSAQAMRWYHTGALIMQMSKGNVYAALVLRALAFSHEIQCDSEIVADLAWLEPTYELSARRHRLNHKVDPLIRYAIYVLDRRFGIKEATEIICPPIPAAWERCISAAISPHSGDVLLRMRRLEMSELRMSNDDSVTHMQLSGSDWLEFRSWRTFDNAIDGLETYSAIGSDNRIYWFYRTASGSTWGMRKGKSLGRGNM